MKRTISEERALKKLGISDFRHMTKDKIVKFASVLPHMEPEVAKKALEQFPAFKELASDLVIQYKGIVDRAMESNDIGQNAFYEACNSIIQSLQGELEDENITQEEKNRIEDKMIRVAQMIGEKDSENKVFLKRIVEIGAGVIIALGLAGAAILGSSVKLAEGDYDDDDDDEDDDVLV